MAYFGYETFNSVPTLDQLLVPGASQNYGSVNDPQLTTLIQKSLTSSANSDFLKAYETYAAPEQLPGAINFPDSYQIYAVSKNVGGRSPTVRCSSWPQKTGTSRSKDGMRCSLDRARAAQADCGVSR